MHWRLLTMLSWHTLCITNELLTMFTPCHSPFKHTDPNTAKRWCQDGFWWDYADSDQSSQRPWGVFSRNETYRMLLSSKKIFPLLFNLLETFVHVALLVRPLWSENISECSLLSRQKTQELWSCKESNGGGFFFFLPAQQSLLKIKFIYYCWFDIWESKIL